MGCSFDADRMRLEQALGNLVDNALRYGGDEVTLEATRRDGADSRSTCETAAPGFLRSF